MCKLSLVAVLTLLSAVVHPCIANQSPAIDNSLARQYFQEAKAVSDKDHGQLWGVTLYGPMLFADPESGSVVANQADEGKLLRSEAGVFVGKLPDDVGIANTSTKWSGTTWTMIVWPLPADRRERVALMMHELFHAKQDSIGLPATNPTNSHLDSRDGRIWLRLEWRALERALYEQGAARREALTDALYFRRYRQSLWPRALWDENALELNEGLAEYTGVKLSSRSPAECLARAGYALHQAGNRQTFSRSFAYVTGPAYGLLLDEITGNWRRKIKAGGDLSSALQRFHQIRVSPTLQPDASLRSKRYDGDEIIAREEDREKNRQATIAKYRSRLIEGPVLVLPVGGSFHYTFNPNNVVSLEDIGTIYPTATVTDDWGTLQVSDGILMFRNGNQIKKLHVTAPSNIEGRQLQGTGWKLTLDEQWTLQPGERKGDFVLRRKP